MNPVQPQTSKRQRRQPQSSSQWQRKLVYLGIGLVCVYLLLIFVRSIRNSALLDKRDRVNVVFYAEEAVLLSFGLVDDVHYIVSFSHADKVSIPGGYGRYLVGSLGKLSKIEKDEELVARTFSSMSSAYVDYYVIPRKPDVYEKPDTDSPAYIQKDLTKRLFSKDFTTNGNIIDKIYLAYLISKYREQDFVILRSISEEGEDGGLDFSERRFLKKYKGFFYHQSLREESKEIGIEYDDYAAAQTLSRVIEGQGIRVVDLAKSNEELKDECVITYSEKQEKSKTAYYLSDRFDCKLVQGDTENADIKIHMGNSLSETWK